MKSRIREAICSARTAEPDARGFSLIEVIVSTLIATIAVMGLAHSFGLGRALINRFEVRRSALVAVQSRLEILAVTPPGSLHFAIGSHPATPIPFDYQGRNYGTESWTVAAFDDPAISGTDNMKQVTARVVLTGFGVTETVSMTRIFPSQ